MEFTKNSFLRRLVFLIGGAAVIALVVFAVKLLSKQTAGSNGAVHATKAAVPVIVTIATRQDVPNLLTTIGTVQSIDSVNIQPRATGTIEKIEFTPGQDVKQGQELFLIDPRPYQAALDQAKAQLAHDQAVLAEAQTDLVRYQTLQQEKAIPAQQAQDQAYVVDQDKGTVQIDQANVEAAQLNLDYAHITAPISGRTGTLQVDLGNLVGPVSGASPSNGAANTSAGATSGAQATSSTPLVSITQLQPIYVSFAVPQTALDQINRNQAAGALDVDAYSQAGKLLEKGKLTVINNQVNVSTGTVTMQATFANADESLWPGELVRIALVIAMRNDVVTVPTQAVVAGPNGSYVYVIEPNEKVKRVGVQVTVRQNGVAVIAKGLSGGERVVTDGQYRLADGVKVAVRETTNVPAASQLSEAE